MPARWPSSATAVSHWPRCATATLSTSCARTCASAPAAASSDAASMNVVAIRLMSSSARRYLHHFLDLLGRQRRGEELVLDRLGHDRIEPDDAIRRQARLRHESPHLLHDAVRQLGEFRVVLERSGV